MAASGSAKKIRIGVLALQGDFREHRAALRRLGVETTEVRLPRDLDGLDGLIIPGGESTTISKLMQAFGLEEPVRALARRGKAIWGTCAGMIVISRESTGLTWKPLGFINLSVQRNAYGRQVDSFEEDVKVPAFGDQPFRAVFIRAPVISHAGRDVEVLARLADGTPVAARKGNVLVTSFHPELTEDTRFHELFLRMVKADGASTG